MWKRKWVVLREDQLVYYDTVAKDVACSPPDTVLQLDFAHLRRSPMKDHSNAFQVFTAVRSYVFSADSV